MIKKKRRIMPMRPLKDMAHEVTGLKIGEKTTIALIDILEEVARQTLVRAGRRTNKSGMKIIREEDVWLGFSDLYMMVEDE